MEPEDIAPDAGADAEGGDSTRYLSLDQALMLRRIPLENHALIRRAVAHLGIVEFYGTSAYIRGVRPSGGPDIRIASGWSNGFVSEDEVLSALGDVERWPSGRAPGNLWGITHPKHGAGRSGGPQFGSKRDYGTCPECTMAFHANGTCGCE